MHHKHKEMYELCKTHMHSYVLAELTDGSQFDGIVTGLDDENVYFAVPTEVPEGVPSQGQMPVQQGVTGQMSLPQQGQPMQYPVQQGQPMQMPGNQQMPMFDQGQRVFGWGYPGYGYGYPGYGYGYGRPRFRRLVLPLAALAALSVLPWY
ncbi:hypothetical protein [Ornithinibacillus halophilus]|uniref:Uncharacterized protein n=1 Tax=Ornithinibacillus halophilus TaxID=930117 RepID=A0A1M5I431_9BACI|nr:hypothetical protein [Ornithinibacillus halophilus]SHG23002.1 hypothetical protein SAMN05216225_102141 [Ornithinibacillus halophilus]